MKDSAVLPFYIVCDESVSMETFGIDALNRALPEIHAAIAGDPLVSDRCPIGIIAFSDTAKELLPLCNLAYVVELPGLIVGGATNYGEAFRLLSVVISRDVAELKSQGNYVHRPAVFFITGSEPTDDWEASHLALTDKNVNPQAPHIVAFGVAGANSDVIFKVGISGAFFAGKDVNIKTIFKKYVAALTQMRMTPFDRLDHE